MQEQPQSLRFVQLNVNKSNTSQSALLHSVADFDLVFLQEPHIDFLKNTRASQQWRVLYPPKHKDSPLRTRSVTLINTRIATNSWTAIPVDDPDITAVSLTYDTGTIHVFNIYNPQDSNRTLGRLARVTHAILDHPDLQLDDPQFVWLGDFNRHHPLWEDERNTQLLMDTYLNNAQPLLDLLSNFDFHMLLPPATPTLEAAHSKNHTRPDNVFASPELAGNLIRCRTAPEIRPPCTDHYPIVTELQVNVARATPSTFRNFRKVDWPDFRKKLAVRLEDIPLPPGNLTSVDEFDTTLRLLLDALQATIDNEVPETRPPPYAKRWFSKELNDMCREVSRTGRRAYRLRDTPQHPIHHEYRTLRNRYGDRIKQAKRDHWEAWIAEADMKSIWTVGKYVRAGSTDGGRSSIPPIRRPGAAEPTRHSAEKSTIFYETFFPAPPPGAARRVHGTYPRDVFDFANISDAQIVDACHRLKEFKAPGPDGIPNEVYKKCTDLLLPFLGRLFRATFDLEHYPDAWKESTTVVLRKPGRADYSIAKSYRPIALMNCMGKLLSSCVTDVLEFQAEKLGLLPNTHFGGRAGRTTTDSLHFITKTIRDAWRAKKVASILFLDVEAAFPSAIPERLFHFMRQLGIPELIVNWLRNKLRGRRTRLKFDDFTSQLFEIISGIDQGCPLSVILYKIYNSLLIRCADDLASTFPVAYIDDVAAVAVGRTLLDTTADLRTYMTRPRGALHWSRKANSFFNIPKLALVHFDPRLLHNDLGPDLDLPGGIVHPSASTKFLGVIVDGKLKFKQHAEYALAKGTKWLQQFGRLARPKNGIRAKHVLTLYKQMLIPAMLYAASVWITPQRKVATRKNTYGSVGLIRKLARVHRQACLLITGAMRTTATDVLEAHLNLLPFHLLVDSCIVREATRLCSLPSTHPLHPHVHRATCFVKRHRSPLHEVLAAYDLHPTDMETIAAVRLPPGWRAPFPVEVAPDKDAASAKEDLWVTRPGHRIYTDGSDYEEGVGTSAVLYCPGTVEPTILRYHLGPSSWHTVYEAEIVGLILGISLLLRLLSVAAASCAADNTPCLLAYQNRKPHPAHYLIDHLLDDLASLRDRHPGIKYTLRWVPGHRGHDGNERADAEAKRAATGDNSPEADLPRWLTRDRLPASLSKVRQRLNETFRKAARAEWTLSPRAPRAARVDPDLPSKKFLALVAPLPRRQASLLIQLRTEHAPLNYHLHRITKADSALCPNCQQARETVAHLLLDCPEYEGARARMRHKLGPGATSLQYLLTSSKALPHLFQFLHDTRRFAAPYGDLLLHDQ